MEQKQAVQAIQKKKESGIFQAITLIALALFWVGYAFALYRANERNVSSYFSLIMIFSLINADLLFTTKRAQNRALNILGKGAGHPALCAGGVGADLGFAELTENGAIERR